MQAGEIGVVITVDPQVGLPGNLTTLTGATVKLTATLLEFGQNPTPTVMTMTVSGDGKTATYGTAATDFPVGGQYEVRVSAQFDAGHLYKSPLQIITVGN
jgi:hypothetical protein